VKEGARRSQEARRARLGDMGFKREIGATCVKGEKRKNRRLRLGNREGQKRDYMTEKEEGSKGTRNDFSYGEKKNKIPTGFPIPDGEWS